METKQKVRVGLFGKLWNSFTKQERSWIAYDWANSIYATNIMAAIFPIYYAMVATDLGNKWYGIGVSVSSFIVALLSPILGALGDIKGYKKKLLTAFMLIGVVFTATMAIFDNWQLMLVGYVISHIGFSGSCVFYDSFLTDVTTHDRIDRVSAWGYAMGYIGGSTIPFIISIVVLMLCNYSAFSLKFSILIVSVWWLLFSIPILKNVKQVHYIEAKAASIAKTAWKNFVTTIRGIFKNRGLLIFLIAYFFYIDGVGTIISLATNYGTTLSLGSEGMILALLVTQIVAVPCSILFSRLAKRFHAIRMIIIAICIYFCITLVGFFMGRMVEPCQIEYRSAASAAFEKYAPKFTVESDAEIWTTITDKVLEDGSDHIADSADTRKEAYFAFYKMGEDGVYSSDAVISQNMLRCEDPAGAYYNDSSYTQYDFSSDEVRAAVYNALDSVRTDETFIAAVMDTSFTERSITAADSAAILFWVLAAMVGTVQGGIQALSRSYYAKLVPPNHSNEYFGFFDIFAKFAAVMGPALYAFCYMLTGRASYGILSLLVLFLIGALLLILGRTKLRETEDAVEAARLASGAED